MGVNNKVVEKLLKEGLPIVAMLGVQIFASGMQVLSKVILNDGTFIFALMAYRHLVATLCVAPFAFFFERRNANKLSCKVLFWLFLSASTGITGAMGLYYYGLRDTTATYASNFLNLIPVVTFVISCILRMEKVGLKRRAGQVRVVGAILCVGGALITSVYKGKGFHIGHHNHDNCIISNMEGAGVGRPHWGRGTLLLIASCFSYATWFVVQVKLVKVFPSNYLATMLTCVIACIQSTLLGFCLHANKASWKLASDLQLLTIFYSGALATAATFCLTTWAISIQGPTFPPMFNPLTLIFVAISEAIILGEEIQVGNILGTCVMVAGLYCFLWGKTKEMKKMNKSAASVVAIDHHPLPLPTSSQPALPLQHSTPANSSTNNNINHN